jgi:hypothetical protein
VPRAKYTKPPGPLPKIEHVQRATFPFRDEQWRKLVHLLPNRLALLDVPSDYTPHTPNRTLKTIADVVVHETEGAISSYLTTERVSSEHRMPTAANVRAAIRRLRDALKPFVHGWVDTDTADIVPAEFDEALAAREREIGGWRLPPMSRRNLQLLCGKIRVFVTNIARANDAMISDQDVLKYIDFALECARIDHPDLGKHRDRLTALVFPKD